MRKLGLVAVAVVGLVSASGAAASAQQSDAVTATGTALGECFKKLVGDFKEKRVAPERFQMAIAGACQQEEKVALDTLEAYLRSTDQGYHDITESSMRSAREKYVAAKQRIVSEYVVWYESSASN